MQPGKRRSRTSRVIGSSLVGSGGSRADRPGRGVGVVALQPKRSPETTSPMALRSTIWSVPVC